MAGESILPANGAEPQLLRPSVAPRPRSPYPLVCREARPEGTIVRARAVLAAGVVLTRSTKVFDLVNEREIVAPADGSLEIPAGAVVVPGSRPASGAFAQKLGLHVATALIVKYRDEKTDAKASLESVLRA